MLNQRYELGEIIGSGGMSDVYAAEDVTLGRSVAIKMLRPEMARDVNFRERFRREAQNSGKLNHPNIVAVLDTGESMIDGLSIPYIVMERINGRTLRDIIKEEGPMSPAEAAEVLRPVCDALQASHEAGIIHRDVKPANIMLTNTGQVKVMDFGIARALDDSTSAMTQTSAVIGTAQYLSPEQARGKHADARSDVYALGCVLYEAVTGRTPFEGETPFAVAYQHVQEEPVPPSQYIKGLNHNQQVNIDAVVLTAMAKHPADRYQSAWELSEELGRLERGSVTQAARMHIESEETPTTTISRHGAPAVEEEEGNGLKWLAGILAAVLIATVGYFGWDFYSNSQALRAQQEQRQSMVTLPQVENRPRAEVQKELEDLGLLVQISQEPSPDIARDRAIRLNPASGSQLQRNSTVILTVSSGKEMTDVPDLSGMKLEDAQRVLKEAGLELDDKVEEVSDSEVPAGEVSAQNPPAGSQLAKGSKVQVTVSRGAQTLRVPNVVGLDVNAARSTLEAQKYKVNVVIVDSEQPQGRVLRIPGSQDVREGDTITLEVSNGLLIVAPGIFRMTESEARAALAAAGWSGTITVGEPVTTPNPLDDGLIGWTSVAEGQGIRKDQNIEIRKWTLVNLGQELGNALTNITGN